jgi:hypothetical protein
MPQLRLTGDPKGKSLNLYTERIGIFQNIHIAGEIKMKIKGKKVLAEEDLVLRNLLSANPELSTTDLVWTFQCFLSGSDS